MNQVLSVNSHKVNVDIKVKGGDTGGECTDQESTVLILASPQTPNSTSEENVNQLASKARDSLEKKKKGLAGSSKKHKKSGSSRGGQVEVIFVLLCVFLSIFL
jgi:hypothetical protein